MEAVYCIVGVLSRRLQVIPFSAVLQCSASTSACLTFVSTLQCNFLFVHQMHHAYYKQQRPVFVFACHCLGVQNCEQCISWDLYLYLYLYLDLYCEPLQWGCSANDASWVLQAGMTQRIAQFEPCRHHLALMQSTLFRLTSIALFCIKTALYFFVKLVSYSPQSFYETSPVWG